jgi:hypothetical protein
MENDMAFNRAYLTTSEFGSKGLLKGKKDITLPSLSTPLQLPEKLLRR